MSKSTPIIKQKHHQEKLMSNRNNNKIYTSRFKNRRNLTIKKELQLEVDKKNKQIIKKIGSLNRNPRLNTSLSM